MKLQLAGLCVALCAVMLSGCVPRIELAAPKEPITINMNVKIEHEIHIKVDKDVDDLLKNKSDLF
ncbi:YnbE family lipoprotein [Rahnella woolbedingensis]|uniref:YnbE family lipoprotein n=1 Tax=Rahnella woolbedingensis TaxID=1510574 RepID=A0A419N1K2_9GAMM|nr:YnbE family lipoprotein [Rahnella woolbedingensis]RJT29839.1 YnbE family lipoprotein [Rahnella woolbedingensis]